VATPPDPLDPTTYAQTDEEADGRFAKWRGDDPFPEIVPALLNTADLLDYIRVTAMICPFVPDKARPDELLKPASVAIPAGGEFLFWQQRHDPVWGGRDTATRQGTLQPGEELVVERNSIVYVGLAPTFRIPDYIAARFNLTIQNIYRGILVGTGPLVDPGFQGHLFLPLHNLTRWCKM
jgi:deoxycytidine triphosphate deaminase